MKAGFGKTGETGDDGSGGGSAGAVASRRGSLRGSGRGGKVVDDASDSSGVDEGENGVDGDGESSAAGSREPERTAKRSSSFRSAAVSCSEEHDDADGERCGWIGGRDDTKATRLSMLSM